MKKQIKQVVDWIKKIEFEKFHIKDEDSPYYLSIAVSAVLFLLGTRAFIELSEILVENGFERFDRAVSDFIVSFRNSGLTDFMLLITDFGDVRNYLIIVGLLTLWLGIKKNFRFVLQSVVVLVLAASANIALKRSFDRPRPDLDHLVLVHDLSYPSGHAMGSMAFYGFLIYLALRYIPNRLLRISVSIFLGLLILTIGVSRVYLSVHYPSDVLAGFAGGLIWVTFCIIVFNLISLWRSRRRQLARHQLEKESFKPKRFHSRKGPSGPEKR